MKYRYPCTGHISIQGFGAFLESEEQGSRYHLAQFRKALSDRVSAPFLTLVNSGSSANLVAALALAEKVRARGLPMTAAISAFTFPTTVSALSLAGFDLQIVDVTEHGFNISVDALKALNPVPSVTAITHFLGFPCAVEEIADYVHQAGCFLLQDCCETLGMEVNGRPVFLLGDYSTWSFYHPHHLSSYGGGAVISLTLEDDLLADSITHWGRSCKCHIDESLCTVPQGPAHQFTYERLGLNVELSELNACFGRWQLLQYDRMEAERCRNYQLLYDRLCRVPQLQVWEAPDTNSSAFVFPVRLRNGMRIYDAFPILKAEGIEMRTLMGGVSNEQAAFRELLGTELLPNAHEMAETTFFVGVHQTLPEEDVRQVAERLAVLLGT